MATEANVTTAKPKIKSLISYMKSLNPSIFMSPIFLLLIA